MTTETPDLDRDTPVVIELIAELHPPEFAPDLCALARKMYACSDSFRSSLRRRDAVDMTHSWFHHWTRAERLKPGWLKRRLTESAPR